MLALTRSVVASRRWRVGTVVAVGAIAAAAWVALGVVLGLSATFVAVAALLTERLASFSRLPALVRRRELSARLAQQAGSLLVCRGLALRRFWLADGLQAGMLVSYRRKVLRLAVFGVASQSLRSLVCLSLTGYTVARAGASWRSHCR